MALLYLLHAAAPHHHLRLSVAHVNYGLRKEASEQDELMVRQTCATLELPLTVKKVSINEWESTSGTGIEEKARNLRYDFFFKLLFEQQMDALAVGHTQDDLLETLLFNLLRGSSPEKFAQILPACDHHRRVLRPLLSFSKKRLVDYLHEEGHAFCIDESNFHAPYSRNLLRNKVLPVLEQINPQSAAALLRFRDISALEQDYFQQCIERLKKPPLWEKLDHHEASLRIRRPLFLQLHPAQQYRLLREARQETCGNKKDFYYRTIDSILKGIHNSVQFRYNDKMFLIWTRQNWVYFKRNEEEKNHE